LPSFDWSGDQHKNRLGFNRLLLILAFTPRGHWHYVPHVPQIFDVRDVERVQRIFARSFRRTSSHRHRRWHEASLRVLYVNALLQWAQRGIPGPAMKPHVVSDDDYRFIIMRHGDERCIRQLFALARDPCKFFCINDDRHDPAGSPAIAATLELFRSRCFPDPSPFELSAMRAGLRHEPHTPAPVHG
ncbi:MAG: hypothetical protein QOK29_5038, partial [Rhodospirillaceae bacterium]|nr:hypothetical protein [Rhodospirillaceae bacterium]